MTSRDELRRQVEERASGRCEYCRMHQSLQGATFHVEHVIPLHRGGPTNLQNLAWACPGCNLHKAGRIEATDPKTGQSVPIFNPRIDRWTDHFHWEQFRVVAVTGVARATAAALEFNHPRRLQIRQAEELFGLFPPGT